MLQLLFIGQLLPYIFPNFHKMCQYRDFPLLDMRSTNQQLSLSEAVRLLEENKNFQPIVAVCKKSRMKRHTASEVTHEVNSKKV